VAVFGLVAGLALAIPSVRALDALLFETSSYEPLTWALVVAIVGATTTVAAWLPARRAARVDPREVLSAE
jgi:ABC-type antimicrobial peptide transport system permease subunit